ncbi:hypothetical protein EG68_06098 [Paragonimus skrjabini miyazakii]|uniref:Uncharacterized protein n=1 Tax=Paragonimus skrjabini miyazakii TaxID=59628 RepID=A0A8S9YUR5_9TREM|nr:hypothetical protein EG68_06098 [Paragonimus skrjabini miyazakii]
MATFKLSSNLIVTPVVLPSETPSTNVNIENPMVKKRKTLEGFTESSDHYTMIRTESIPDGHPSHSNDHRIQAPVTVTNGMSKSQNARKRRLWQSLLVGFGVAAHWCIHVAH